MSTDTSTANAADSDPRKTVADVMQTAVQAARDGVSDAQESAANAGPAIGRFLSRFVYTTSYTISYGVVFPTMFLVSAVPKDNALVHGLVDGGRAAREKVERWKDRSHAEDAAVDPEPAHVEDVEHDESSHDKATSHRKPRRSPKKHAPDHEGHEETGS